MLKEKQTQLSLRSLFWNFFLIGSYSFGGYMALISIVRKELVEKKKVLTDEHILDGISLASILPGPVAVNAVVYYGFILNGIKGAIVSFLGILLPTFLLVTGFAVYYFSIGAGTNIDFHISFVIPVIVAVIASVGFNMAKKQMHFFSQGCIALIAFVIATTASSVFFLIITIILGGISGYFLYEKSESKSDKHQTTASFLTGKELKTLILSIISVALFVFILAFITDQIKISMYLVSVFSGMSLTLFGGGYVIIPIIEQAVVNDLGWLTIQEFNAAISISQVTPGPIMTSVTFIGYRMAGFTGAIAGTFAIFMPSALLMLLLSHFQQRIKHLKYIDAVMKGVRSVVIGLIFSGAFSIGLKHFDQSIMPWAIFIIALLLFMFTKIHPALVILITLLFSFI
jgi:chromate transporter